MALRNSWAEIPELLRQIFDFEGSASVMGEYDSWNFSFVQIDNLKDRDTKGTKDNADIVYDVVHDYINKKGSLKPSWWSEYVDSRQRHSAVFHLVVTERPVGFNLQACPESSQIQVYTNDSLYSKRVVIVADVSAAFGRDEKASILTAAREAIARIASERGLYSPAAQTRHSSGRAKSGAPLNSKSLGVKA